MNKCDGGQKPEGCVQEPFLVTILINELSVKNCTAYNNECLCRSQQLIAFRIDKHKGMSPEQKYF